MIAMLLLQYVVYFSNNCFPVKHLLQPMLHVCISQWCDVSDIVKLDNAFTKILERNISLETSANSCDKLCIVIVLHCQRDNL